MEKKKGNSGIVYFFGILAILLIAMGTMPGVLKADPNEKMELVLRNDDTHTILNSLKLAKKYLEVSLDFSVFRIYDNEYLIDVKNKEKTKSEIESDILGIMNSYTESGTRGITVMGKTIFLNKYNSISIDNSGTKMSVKAESDSELAYEISSMDGNSFMTMKEDADIIRTFDFDILSMMDEAEKIYNKELSTECSNRKLNEDCDVYKCKLTATKEDTKCKTKVIVSYENKRYPVLNNGEGVFKNMQFIFYFYD